MSEKLEKYVVCPDKGCWIWTGCVDRDGYGRIRGSSYGKHWFVFAHRASYEYHVRKIEEGKLVLHRCNNPTCINPEHLYLGSNQDNANDMVAAGHAKGTSNPGKLNGMYGRSGSLNPMFGKKHTPETLEKMRKPKKKKAIRDEPETRAEFLKFAA